MATSSVIRLQFFLSAPIKIHSVNIKLFPILEILLYLPEFMQTVHHKAKIQVRIVLKLMGIGKKKYREFHPDRR